jgi:hypothetical protein
VSDAHEKLIGLLETALGGQEKIVQLLEDTLHDADVAELPELPEDLLDFARTHLRERLAKELGPTLTAAVLADLAVLLELEAEHAALSQSARRAPTVRVPAVGRPLRGEEPPARTSVSALVSRASTRIRAAVAAGRSSGLRLGRDIRPTVYVVHRDRVVRASLARALLSAHFDVSALDSLALTPNMSSGTCVAITDLREDCLDAALRKLVAAVPDIRVLAWTDANALSARQILRDSGVERVAVADRTNAEVEVVHMVRRLLAG